MEEKRVTVYGEDAEQNQKRMFDWIVINGRAYMETKDSHGHRIRTPATKAFAAYKKIQPKQQPFG